MLKVTRAVAANRFRLYELIYRETRILHNSTIIA